MFQSQDIIWGQSLVQIAAAVVKTLVVSAAVELEQFSWMNRYHFFCHGVSLCMFWMLIHGSLKLSVFFSDFQSLFNLAFSLHLVVFLKKINTYCNRINQRKQMKTRTKLFSILLDKKSLRVLFRLHLREVWIDTSCGLLDPEDQLRIPRPNNAKAGLFC